jgi:hypothetical protein
MNFSEFKKLLGADPMNKEPETLRARENGPEFEQAAAEAEAFEQKLKAVLDLPVDSEGLVADILAAPRVAPGTPARRIPGWMAIAAGLVIVVGVAAITMKDGIFQPDTVEQYVIQHYGHDGEKLLAKAGNVVEAGEVSRMMAAWNMEADPELMDRVTFIKRCFTMEGMGAHMIVQTDQGPVNLIVMPKTVVTDRRMVEFDNMQAYLIALGGASAAIIGRKDQSVAAMDALVRNSISRSI